MTFVAADASEVVYGLTLTLSTALGLDDVMSTFTYTLRRKKVFLYFFGKLGQFSEPSQGE